MTPGQKWYSEARKDPRWQKRRLEIMERDDWQCQNCWSKSRTLNVHHKKYVSGLKPWEYSGCALVTLCEDCHQAEPGLVDAAISQFRQLEIRLTAAEMKRVIYLIGMANRELSGQNIVELIGKALPPDEDADNIENQRIAA